MSQIARGVPSLSLTNNGWGGARPTLVGERIGVATSISCDRPCAYRKADATTSSTMCGITCGESCLWHLCQIPFKGKEFGRTRVLDSYRGY